MWTDIFEVALKSGIFAVLFVFLLFYVLKDSRKREQKYQDTIEKLSNHIDVVKDVKKDVIDIKRALRLPVKTVEEKR